MIPFTVIRFSIAISNKQRYQEIKENSISVGISVSEIGIAFGFLITGAGILVGLGRS